MNREFQVLISTCGIWDIYQIVKTKADANRIALALLDIGAQAMVKEKIVMKADKGGHTYA